MDKIEQPGEEEIATQNQTEDESITCRICCTSEPAPDLQACNCADTIGHVHFECLKGWIEASGSLQCEICQANYTGVLITKRLPSPLRWMQTNPLHAFIGLVVCAIPGMGMGVALNVIQESAELSSAFKVFAYWAVYGCIYCEFGLTISRTHREYIEWVQENSI